MIEFNFSGLKRHINFKKEYKNCVEFILEEQVNKRWPEILFYQSVKIFVKEFKIVFHCIASMKIFAWIQYAIRFVHLLLLALIIVIKSYLFSRSKRTTSLFDRECRIAIVGGGIAGVAAAYSLVRHRYQNVTIYEASSKLGGNARTHQWQTNRFSVTTGLSVLAWPKFFRNYDHLLKELNIRTTTVQLPFFIHNRKENRYFAHGQQHNHNQEYNQDLKK